MAKDGVSRAQRPIAYEIDTHQRIQRIPKVPELTTEQDSFSKVSPHAVTQRIHLRPAMPKNKWMDLRKRFATYLRFSKPGEPVSLYTDIEVTAEERELLTSRHYRHIELETNPIDLADTIRFTIRGVTSELPSLRDTASTVLFRLARAHLDETSPHVVRIFRAARDLFARSDGEGHIGNRDLASRIMIHTNPYLPQDFMEVYPVAEMLRKAILKQDNDVLNLIGAYRAMVHCFSADHPEITEGCATFGGLGRQGKDGKIVTASRVTFMELIELKRSIKTDGGDGAFGIATGASVGVGSGAAAAISSSPTAYSFLAKPGV